MPRDESWFERLGECLELERRAQRERLDADRASLTLGELEARGHLLLDLEAAEEEIGLGGRILVTLERGDRQPLPARFSPGDLVELRPRKAEVASPAAATVARVTSTRVQVAFERAPPDYVRQGRLRVDRIPNDVTFDRAREGLRRIAALDKGKARHTREVILGREPPRSSAPRPFEPSRPLNPEQAEAVAQSLAAEDFFLVHGPPGTGKSTVLAEIAVQAVAAGKKLLCTAASNAAVDHLLDLCLDRGLRAVRIGHPARVSERLQQHTLDLLVEAHPDRVLSRDLFDEAFALLGYARRQRTQGRSRNRFAQARESKAEAARLFDEARALEKKAVGAVLDRADVLCATLAMLQTGPLAGVEVDLALVDEATQAVEPLALLAFLRAPTVILAGDHRQLPPTVLSADAVARGFAVSLFERLLDEHGDAMKRMLREQYRMNERIMEFPSREMYAGELRAHPSVATWTLGEVLSRDADAPPVLFIDTAGTGFEEARAAGDQSVHNEGEASLVAARARDLLASGLPPGELAVITPYRAQAALIRERLPDPMVEIDTVDAFQGREKDAVLVSLTRSNSEGQLGFLIDLRRMNVAITRARRHLFVVGDSATLGAHPFYARFIEMAQRCGGYRSAWEWPGARPG